MKKLFLIFILMTFLTVQFVFAAENGINIISVTNDDGKTENIFVNKKCEVERVEEGSVDIVLKPVPEKQDMMFKEYIKNAPKEIKNYRTILRKYHYGKNDKSRTTEKYKYQRLALQDGDYAIRNVDKYSGEGLEYIAEYHKNGKLMGLVKFDSVDLNNDEILYIFYEYRLKYNSKDGMGLKHVLFTTEKKGLYNYIYSADGELLCAQKGNDIYVSENGKNLLPNWSRLGGPYSGNSEIKDMLVSTGIVAAAPIWVPALAIYVIKYGSGIK